MLILRSTRSNIYLRSLDTHAENNRRGKARRLTQNIFVEKIGFYE